VVGAVAVNILTFGPDLIKISIWLSDLVIKFTPTSVKTYLLSRDLHQLHTFFTTLDDNERVKVNQYLNLEKALNKVYEATKYV
jgi:hypothetical protein